MNITEPIAFALTDLLGQYCKLNRRWNMSNNAKSILHLLRTSYRINLGLAYLFAVFGLAAAYLGLGAVAICHEVVSCVCMLLAQNDAKQVNKILSEEQ